MHFYYSTHVCNIIVISVFKALQKHQLTTHDNYNYNFVIFAYTRPHIEPNWTCSRARFTLVANRNANAFTFHWTGRVKITTFPNHIEPGPVKITPLNARPLAKIHLSICIVMTIAIAPPPLGRTLMSRIPHRITRLFVPWTFRTMDHMEDLYIMVFRSFCAWKFVRTCDLLNVTGWLHVCSIAARP